MSRFLPCQGMCEYAVSHKPFIQDFGIPLGFLLYQFFNVVLLNFDIFFSQLGLGEKGMSSVPQCVG